MTIKPSEAEAVLLARRVARASAAKSELKRTSNHPRIPAFMIWGVGFIILGGYARELSAYFGASKDLLGLLVALSGGLVFLAAEVANLRRKVSALAELVQSAQSDASQETPSK